MRVVYYANYLIWMEAGRTDFCKSMGFHYKEMEHEGAFLVVAEASCRYRSPAGYDDPIVVETRLDRLSRRVIAFGYSIRNDETGRLLAEGTTVHITVGKNQKPRSIPERFFELMKKAAPED